MKHTKKEPLRKCRGCGLEAFTAEDLERFMKNSTCKHGRHNLCKGCHNTRAGKYHADNRKDPEYQARRRLEASKRRAKKAKVPHTITVDDILEVDSDICPCCKKPQTWDPDADRNVTKNLDKVIPELGYVPGNIQIICGECNRLKDKHTVETLRMLLANIEKHLESNKER